MDKVKKTRHTCAVATCPSPVDVSYHRFPKDTKLQKQWEEACKRKDSINVKTALVCDLHFKDEDFKRDFQNELLNLPLRKLLIEGNLFCGC